MKHIELVVLLAIGTSSLFAQGNGTYHQFDLDVEGIAREYLLYAPEGTEEGDPRPLVFVFHGYHGNANEIRDISQMYLIADTAKFLIVYPEGLPVYSKEWEVSTFGWNVPDIYIGDQNDVSFVNHIIDDLTGNVSFNIDIQRIYATGYSNGGRFSYYLAFKLSNRIASVASVAGQISDTLINFLCTPARKISILHIQGSNDSGTPEDGSKFHLSLKGITDYWARVNDCNPIADSTLLEDIDLSDSSTVTLFEYNGCDQETEVNLYRINGGGHTWPGGWINPDWNLGVLNNDINASSEIWSFFKSNPHPNEALHNSASLKKPWLTLFPNPTSKIIYIKTSILEQFKIEITSLNGQLIFNKEMEGTTHQLDLSSFQKGVYFITIRSEDFVTTKKIIKL